MASVNVGDAMDGKVQIQKGRGSYVSVVDKTKSVQAIARKILNTLVG